SSLSQMIAVWSPRAARWRSRQETEAFSVPSSNHLIDTSPLKLVFLILVGGLIQATRRRASSLQNPSGSRAARSYSERYWASFTCALAANSARTGKIWPSGEWISDIACFLASLFAVAGCTGYRSDAVLAGCVFMGIRLSGNGASRSLFVSFYLFPSHFASFRLFPLWPGVSRPPTPDWWG